MLYLNYLFSKYLLIVKRFGSLRERRYISVYYYYIIIIKAFLRRPLAFMNVSIISSHVQG